MLILLILLCLRLRSPCKPGVMSAGFWRPLCKMPLRRYRPLLK